MASREHDYECLHEVVPEKEARAQYMRAVIKDGRDHHSRIAEFEVYSR